MGNLIAIELQSDKEMGPKVEMAGEVTEVNVTEVNVHA